MLGGLIRELLQDAKSAITANKTARGSHSYTNCMTVSIFRSTCGSVASKAGHFQSILVLAPVKKPLSFTEQV